MTQNPPPGWQPGGPQQPPQAQQPWQQSGPPQPPQQQPQFGGSPAPQQQFGGPPPPPPPGAQGYGPPQGQPKKKSKVPLVVAGVLALALIIGGVYFGLSFFRGSSPAAAQGLPSDVVVAVELNLAPAAADQLALARIVNKFPVDDQMSETDNYKEALWNLLPDDADAPPFSEVEPWLGDSVAMGFRENALTSSASGEHFILAIETKDKGRAEAFAAAEFGDDTQVFFVDDIMVVADASDSVTADSIQAAPLADDEEYQADLAKLGGGSLATVWFGSGAAEMLIDEAGETTGVTPTADLEMLRGMHGAMGVKVEENKLTLESQIKTPNAPDVDVDDVRDFASALPGNALGAFAIATAEESFTQLWDVVQQDPSMVQAANDLGITSAADLYALIGKEVGVSVAMDEQAGMPIIGARFVTENPAKQKEILDNLNELMAQSGMGEAPFALEQDGDAAYLAFGQGIDAVRNPSSTLGDSDAYKDVVDGDADSVFFVDFNAIKQLSFYQEAVSSSSDAEMAKWLEPLRTMGGVATNGGDDYSTSEFHVTFN